MLSHLQCVGLTGPATQTSFTVNGGSLVALVDIKRTRICLRKFFLSSLIFILPHHLAYILVNSIALLSPNHIHLRHHAHPTRYCYWSLYCCGTYAPPCPTRKLPDIPSKLLC